ncbi:MAG: Nitrate reductase gamma subunit [Deltaproteobacteria bacterium]|jgi:nitrate reductase gamma subunit|nr:Nitrate reductase gamma subunit [Deltaproteobacteria bacterium]
MGFYILTYLCIAVFIGATGCLIYRQLNLPLHVRWEIYPVRHETTAKLAYGGSYMEEVNWWNNPYKSSRFNELKYMVPEILFLRGLWKENRSLWRVSFPLHFGLYLMISTFGLLLLHTCLTLWGFSAIAAGGAVNFLLSVLIVSAGWSGLILGNIGSLGMLYRRLTDRELRDYSSFADYFNILFICLFFLSAFVACLSGDPFLEGAKAYTFGLLTAGSSLNRYAPGQNVIGMVTIVSASLLVAYIPLTQMSHMFMKYFLYHNVKWDDLPNRPGGQMEVAIKNNFKLKPTWQAKHIGANGQKSWHDIASSAPKEMK